MNVKRYRDGKTAQRLGMNANEILAPIVNNEDTLSFTKQVTSAFVELEKADLSLIPKILPKKYHNDEVAQEIVSILQELETQLIVHRNRLLQEKGETALHLYDIKCYSPVTKTDDDVMSKKYITNTSRSH